MIREVVLQIILLIILLFLAVKQKNDSDYDELYPESLDT